MKSATAFDRIWRELAQCLSREKYFQKKTEKYFITLPFSSIATILR